MTVNANKIGKDGVGVNNKRLVGQKTIGVNDRFQKNVKSNGGLSIKYVRS